MQKPSIDERAIAQTGIDPIAMPARPRRARNAFLAEAPATRIRRILMLADHFRTVAAPGLDPARQLELLRTLLPLAREMLGDEAARGADWLREARLVAERTRCARDLERLMHALAAGRSTSREELCHAMDALIMQCMLVDEGVAQAREAAAP